MADGPLHPAGGSLEGLGHLGVEYLGDGVDYIHIPHGNDDGLPEILIALDMGGNADFVDDVGDHGFDVGLSGLLGGQHLDLLGIPPDFLEPFYQGIHIAGLQHQIPHSQIGTGGSHIVGDKSGCSQHHRPMLHGAEGFQDGDAVLLGQHQIQHQNVRSSLGNQQHRLFPFVGGAHYLKGLGFFQSCRQIAAKIL